MSIYDEPIGGPCPKCGIAQVAHAGLTCDEARAKQQEETRAYIASLRIEEHIKKASMIPKDPVGNIVYQFRNLQIEEMGKGFVEIGTGKVHFIMDTEELLSLRAWLNERFFDHE